MQLSHYCCRNNDIAIFAARHLENWQVCVCATTQSLHDRDKATRKYASAK